MLKITRIEAFQVDLPLHEGSYKWSGGNSVEVFDSTVVAVHTDAGHHRLRRGLSPGTGLPAGVCRRGARRESPNSAPHLLGLDPTELGKLQRPDGRRAARPSLRQVGARHGVLGYSGQGGRACRWRRCWAGATATTFALYRAISQETPAGHGGEGGGYRAEGYTKFQLKVGGDPDTDIERIRAVAAQAATRRRADRRRQHRLDAAPGAARGPTRCATWTSTSSSRAARYDECLAVRRHTDRPFVLDEVVDGIDMVVRGHARPGDGRDQSEDFEGRRLDPGAADPRSVRVAGNRDDHRGHLGRRHHHGGHRASGAQHAAGLFFPPPTSTAT